MKLAPNETLYGYYNGQTVKVNQNQIELPRTVAHERLHQLRSPRFRERYGENFDEGITEHLASRIYRDLNIKNLSPVYREHRTIVQMMEARVGEETIAKSYFSGNLGYLRGELDSQLGRGATTSILLATERGDFRAARRILMGEVR